MPNVENVQIFVFCVVTNCPDPRRCPCITALFSS